MKKSTLLVMLAVLAGNMNAQTDTTQVRTLALSEEHITIEQGDIYQLTATITPDNAANRSMLMWCGNNIASVDRNGLVTGREVGSTKVTALFQECVKNCDVVVKASDWPIIKGGVELPLVETGGKLEEAYNFVLKEGKLHLNGTFVGNACYPSKLKYEIYKHTIFLSLDVNYIDTCWTAGEHTFSQQVIDVTLDNCPADSYTVYLQNFESNLNAEAGSTQQQVRSLQLSKTTQIELPVATETKVNPVYDLQGREVNHPAKGLYIQNGRKVYVN